MKKHFWLALLFLCCAAHSAAGQTAALPTLIEGHGDLYILYPDGGGVRVVAAGADGSILDTTFVSMPENLSLRYVAAGDDTRISFTFSLRGEITHPWKQKKRSKALVVSDLHGRLDAFAALLKGNGVVDPSLNWSYGANHLIFMGDILDRGRDDNGIAWLLYKLQHEAELAGGRVDFLPGNHEDMVLKNDLRYVHKAHFAFAAAAAIPYPELYGTDTELGRWVRSAHLILIVGDDLFVHAGLSPQLVDGGYGVAEMNDLARRYLGFATNERKNLHPRNELLFGSYGPLWYRGLVSEKEKDSPPSLHNVNRILDYYKVDRIIVGHTEVGEVSMRFEGGVIPVNVEHPENFPANRTAGLLIEGRRYWTVNYEGGKQLLK